MSKDFIILIKIKFYTIITLNNSKYPKAQYSSDLNTATDPACIYTTNSNTTNLPPAAAGYWFVQVIADSASSSYPKQIATQMNTQGVFIYVRSKNTEGWGDWELVPKHSEIEALNNKHIILNEIAGSTAPAFVKNLCTALQLPNDIHTYTFSTTWTNMGYVTGLVRRVKTSGGYNGLFKISMSGEQYSKEFTFWSWDNDTFYADQIPTRAEIETLNSNITWVQLLQVVAPANESYDENITVSFPSNAKEIALTLQRNSNGRTFASTVIPISQFMGGGIYASGSFVLWSEAMKDNTASFINVVAIYQDTTHIEIALNAPPEAIKIRVWAR